MKVVASRHIQALKIPAGLASVFVILLAGYFLVYVTRETRYWITRDFRVLATIGAQVQESLENRRTVLQSFLKDPKVFSTAHPNRRVVAERFKSLSENYLPIFRSIEIDDWNTPREDPPVLSLRFVEPDSRRSWVLADARQPSRPPDAKVQLNLKDVLEPLFSGEIQKDIFDSLALATTSGRVIYQTGDPHLQIASLDGLLPRADGQPTEKAGASALPRGPTLREVELAGASYTLFLQPCCAGMTEAPPGARDTRQQATQESGWLICGLIPRSTLKSDGQAFPYAVIALLSGVLLLALFSWPFAKLMLIGELQRVRVYDVVLVGVCALLGLSALTLFAVDLYAYRRLTDTLDGQLKTFAAKILDDAARERNAARDQLDRLVRAALSHRDVRVPNLAERSLLAPSDLEPYPFFESFALMDEEGQQKQKWTLGWFVTPRISVAHREYFTHWKFPQPDGVFLQPIHSATTGATEAVLSARIRDDPLQVGALTIPMRALLNPVVVQGFGFVVIDDAGGVMFHSDPEHNLSEQFFAETDGSRRLRALLNAKHAELLDLRYWGEDHRAYVTPMGDASLPWSLVTFYDKQLVRTVNIESIISAAFYTLIYVACYVLLCLTILVVRSDYRAPWMWPDPARARTYLRLVPTYVLLAGVFAVGLAAFSADALLWTAWLLPFLAWTLSFVVLSRNGRPTSRIVAVAIALTLLAALLWVVAAEDGWVWRACGGMLVAGAAWALLGRWRRPRSDSPEMAPPLNLSYGIAAGSLVLLTAVFPAMAFFKVAHGIHTENFIKYGQLRLALDLEARDAHDRQLESTRILNWKDEVVAGFRAKWRDRFPPDWGLYSQFFFETGAAVASKRCSATGRPIDLHAGTTLPSFLEELLPYYSEASVRLRELMHGGADDRSWRWQKEEGALVFCMDGQAASSVTATSLVPRLIGGRPLHGQWLLIAVVGCVVVVAALAWVIRFAIHRIFVVEVIEPLWSGAAAERPAPSGPKLFLLCGTTAAGTFLKPSHYYQIDLEEADDEGNAQGRWFEQHVERLNAAAPEQNILVLHFEHRLHDPVFNDQKLALVEHLIGEMNRTVVIVSAVSPDLFFGPPDRPAGARATRAADAGAGRRWADLLSTFSLIPVGAAENAASIAPGPRPRLGWRPAAGWAEMLWRINTLNFGQRASFLDDERRDPFVRAVWSDVLPYAWQADERAPLDLSQLLVEVGERLENYYRGLWATCTPAERLVLTQIAAEGLVNEKSSRTVRGLMARGWIRREPHFRLMNETFRRFVLAAASGTEVTALEARHGAWDSVRGPFLTLLAASVVVFFATQRQLFQQTVGVLGALTASLPALVQVMSLLGRRRDPT